MHVTDIFHFLYLTTFYPFKKVNYTHRSASIKRQGSHQSGKSGKILKTFSSQGNQGKMGGFQPNSGEKFYIRELFFKTIFKAFIPFNLRKNVFKTKAFFSRTIMKLHLMRQYLDRPMSLRPHLKRINMSFFN